METFHGLQVEQVSKEVLKTNYVLTGPRGARHRLVRCEDGLLFAIRKTGSLVDIAGSSLFTDRNGLLEAC